MVQHCAIFNAVWNYCCNRSIKYTTCNRLCCCIHLSLYIDGIYTTSALKYIIQDEVKTLSPMSNCKIVITPAPLLIYIWPSTHSHTHIHIQLPIYTHNTHIYQPTYLSSLTHTYITPTHLSHPYIHPHWHIYLKHTYPHLQVREIAILKWYYLLPCLTLSITRT